MIYVAKMPRALALTIIIYEEFTSQQWEQRKLQIMIFVKAA